MPVFGRAGGVGHVYVGVSAFAQAGGVGMSTLGLFLHVELFVGSPAFGAVRFG